MGPVVWVAAVAGLLFVVECWKPNVRQPAVRGWIPRLVAMNLAQVGVVLLGGITWDRWLQGHAVFDGAALPAPAGIALGYVVVTFVYYWWHRARHGIPLLWRWLHQLHHSPARIECLMSFYKHPLEIAINGVLTSLILFVLCGLPAASVAAVVTITGVAELLYHANLRTPWWLGFVFQRPEMHRRHHERGVHRGNFSDLPLWDLLFGTFDNPRETPALCGFAEERERQLGRMLLGRTPR